MSDDTVHLLHVCGARPNFMKVAPVMAAVEAWNAARAEAAGPGGVGGSGFKGKLALGDEQALGAIEFTGSRAIGAEVVDFPVDAGERLGAGFGVEAGADFKGSGFIEQGDVAGNLGHRFAVAYGLVLLAAQEMQRT